MSPVLMITQSTASRKVEAEEQAFPKEGSALERKLKMLGTEEGMLSLGKCTIKHCDVIEAIYYIAL
jgi:hypothetical protein